MEEVQFLEFQHVCIMRNHLKGESVNIEKLVVDINEIYSINETTTGEYVLSLKVHPNKNDIWGVRVETFLIQESDFINAKKHLNNAD